MTTRRTTLLCTAAALALGAGALAVPAAAGATTLSASSSASACDKAPWEAEVQGPPAGFHAGSPGGDYLWHDSRGFHLRVTHGKNHDRRIYSGVITSSAPMKIDPVKLEKGDTAKLSRNHRSLVFVFADHGYIDGVNFHTYCASTLTVSKLHVGNRNLGPKQVYLGATKAHPATVPFRVHRAPRTT